MRITTAKRWYQSRTVWSGILKIAAGIITSIALILSGENALADAVPGILASAWGIYDIIIRFQTDRPVK